MISFIILAEDLTHSCVPTSASWYFNESILTPYQHPSLESFAVKNGSKYLFVVRERESNRPKRKNEGSLERVSNHGFDLVKKELADWPLHYISISVENGTIVLHTGSWGVSPIYVIAKNNQLIGHWNPKELYKYLPSVELNKTLIAHYLITYQLPYSKNTQFKHIHRLTERSVMYWTGKNSLRIKYPDALEQPFVRELKDDVDVLAAFEEILTQSMRRWVHGHDMVLSSELSGGLDSGIISSIASLLTTKKVRTYGLLVMEEFRTSQLARRKELIDRFGHLDTYIKIEEYLPFTQRSSRIANMGFVPWEGCYRGGFGELLSRAAQNNSSLLFTGFGGDELFLPYWEEMASDQQKEYLASEYLKRNEVPIFVRNHAYETYLDTIDDIDRAPKSIIPESSLESTAYGSPVYMSNNIWPVSPFCTPEIVRFCRSLPFSWREERKLQREFLKKAGCSRQVTHPQQPEDFGSVMSEALRQASRDITRLLKNSCLADLGYIEPGKFIDSYRDHIDRPASSIYTNMDFYTVMAIEYAVLSAETKRLNPVY